MVFDFPWRKKKQLKLGLEVIPVYKSPYLEKYATAVNGKVIEIETLYKTDVKNELTTGGKVEVVASPKVGGILSIGKKERLAWSSWRHPDFEKLLISDEQLKIERDTKINQISGTPASEIPITVIPVGEKISEITPSGTFITTSSTTGSIFYQVDETKKK